MTKICRICGKEFESNSSNQKMCSDLCRKKSKRLIQTARKCKLCGKDFIPTSRRQIYCTHGCAQADGDARRAAEAKASIPHYKNYSYSPKKIIKERKKDAKRNEEYRQKYGSWGKGVMHEYLQKMKIGRIQNAM